MRTSATSDLAAMHPDLCCGATPEGDLPPGWLEVADKLLSAFEQALGHDLAQLAVVSIGDENGTLAVAFRFGGADEVADELLSMRSAAEQLSNRTCQECGRPGTKKRASDQFKTLCSDHSFGIDMTDFFNQIDPVLQRLIDAHPLLFRGQAPAVPSYVSDGWYMLIDKLCTDIEAVLGPEACATLEIRQIKEKFGALRFYYILGERGDLHIDFMSPSGIQHYVGRRSTAADDDQVVSRVRDLVNEACAISETICEECGAAGQLRNTGGWYTTLCDRHLAERQATRGRSE